MTVNICPYAIAIAGLLSYLSGVCVGVILASAHFLGQPKYSPKMKSLEVPRGKSPTA